ncbi:hypothetical protein DFH06DRAFT_1349060 [Mycena polygramma]|nr:hypothetical protein DFH06DRAFT_1349060 [Mycena polygramma]
MSSDQTSLEDDAPPMVLEDGYNPYAIRDLQLDPEQVEWLGRYWKRVNLTDLGYVYREGHEGLDCPNPGETTLRHGQGLRGPVDIWVQECLCNQVALPDPVCPLIDIFKTRCYDVFAELHRRICVRQRIIAVRESQCIGAEEFARTGRRLRTATADIREARGQYRWAKMALSEQGGFFDPEEDFLIFL